MQKQSVGQGRFFLEKTKKQSKDAENTIHLRYLIGRENATITTGVKVKTKDWDQAKQIIKKSNPRHSDLNEQLANRKAEIDEMIEGYEATLTITVLRQMLNGEFARYKEQAIDFVELCREANETDYKMDKIRYATYYNANKYMDKFNEFLKKKLRKKTILASEMNGDVVDKYIIWRKNSLGNTNETINKTITPILKGVRLAVSRGLMPSSLFIEIQGKYLSGKRFSEDELEQNDKSVQFLTLEQLQQFVELYNKVLFKRTRDYMDMYLFSFYACGLRFSDILTLRWINIDMETWTLKKVMYKGHRKQYNFFILPEAQEILKRWHKRTGKHVFVFGLLPDRFDMSDDAEMNKARQHKARGIYTSLNEVGNKMGLPFKLGFHTAIHTFAVHALERLKDVHKVSTLLMHSTTAITEKVYAKYLPETMEKDMMAGLHFGILPSS